METGCIYWLSIPDEEKQGFEAAKSELSKAGSTYFILLDFLDLFRVTFFHYQAPAVNGADVLGITINPQVRSV